ncbi:MAG TPA: cupin [Burkholderiales bacterium]|nr:cupin [Burkholderiales bacterium]
MDAPRVIAHLLAPASGVPNHPRWPLLVYPAAVPPSRDLVEAIEGLFARHGWPPAWRNGVHPFHHFHGNAHEALGIYSGEVTVRFGGDPGVDIVARPGDVIVLPAGTGHKRLSVRGALGVVGAYPAGGRADMHTPGAGGSAREAQAAIERVPLPPADPVFGPSGPLFEHWRD